MQPISRPSSPGALACLERYGSAQNILTIFSPSRQHVYCTKDDERLYLGSAPTLFAMAEAYGADVADSWTMIQLRDLSEYAGAREKMTLAQIEELSRVIRSQYGFLKLTELMRFFLLFKSGRFGRFYGSVDTLAVAEAIGKFCVLRREIVGVLERERQQRIAEEEEREHRKHCITYEEHLRRMRAEQEKEKT